MVETGYVPDAGDIVWLALEPSAGHEQSGRRPALVLSPRIYNARAGLCLLCPITRQKKGYTFEVALPDDCAITGVVLADQVRSVDWSAREVTFAVRAPEPVCNAVRVRATRLIVA